MQPGILGTGSVGQALATSFESADHEVERGSRDPNTVGTDRPEDRRVRAAVDAAGVVVLPVPAGAAIDLAGRLADTLAEKPVVDAVVETATGLAADLGFATVVASDLSVATHLEQLARFWIDLSQTHGRDIAFRMLGAD